MHKVRTFFSKESMRRHARVAAFGVLGASIGALLFFLGERGFLAITTIRSSIETQSIFGLGGEDAYTLAPSKPVSLRIPSIDLTAQFEEPLGLKSDRTIEVPEAYETVGWYEYSPTPGELGPAVVLGHVDSFRGPAVFFSLGELGEGDEIFVTREDGMTATFTVLTIERYDQREFPREKVYGDIQHAGLRLVTCTGYFDEGTQRYSHNLVVYAELETPLKSSEAADSTI